MKKSKKAALIGVMTSLAVALSYLEFLIPLGAVPLPGFKIGLANTAVMMTLYLFGLPSAALVSLLRMLLTLFLFSNVNSFLYSAAGAVLSLAAMAAVRKTGFFSEIGVSVTGAVFHNIGQLASAVLLLRSAGILTYFPALVIAAVITGTVNGIIVRLILPPVKKIFGVP